MTFFFKQHPHLGYDIGLLRDGETGRENVQNILARYKLREALRLRVPLFYEHRVREGMSASVIAHKYFGDESLDWIIYVVNDIVDPAFGWPLDYEDFNAFIKKKYGSVETALATLHHYEYIQGEHNVLADGTIVLARYLEVDEDTYNALAPNRRRQIDAYMYEDEENIKRRKIRIPHRDYVSQFLSEAAVIFK